MPTDIAISYHQKGEIKQRLINEIEMHFSPDEMRSFATSILRLADAKDQHWTPGSADFPMVTAGRLKQISRNAIELAKRATILQRQMKVRDRFVPDDFPGEAAWKMLLELFCQHVGGAKVSSKSLCVVSGAPDTTALRHIDKLEELRLIQRQQSPADGRVTLIGLTPDGVWLVGRILSEIIV